MLRLLAVLVLVGDSVNAQMITTETFGTGVNAFSIDFVEIGNPGNAADDTGFGSVAYDYRLGKFEISRDQIEKANSAGGLSLTLADMSNSGGNGVNRPATGISWYEAAKFVNYLNTYRNNHVAYRFDGVGNFQLWEAGLYSGTNPYRHKDAYYFLPSRDEWYKGAYYDPNKLGGAGYWEFPSGSDTAPTMVSGGTSGAVYGQSGSSGPADVYNAGGLSSYGTMAQGGNAFEWNESAYDLSNDLPTEDRELRGGSWFLNSLLEASLRYGLSNPSYDPVNDIGFRVAMIPEPSSLALLLVGGAVLMAGRRRG